VAGKTPREFESHCAVDMRCNQLMRRRVAHKGAEHHAKRHLPVPHPRHILL